METTNSTIANNTLTSIMDGYRKQLNAVSEFYTNAFNSFSIQNKNMWNPLQNQSNLFFNYDSLKSMFIPFNGFNINAGFSNPLNAMVKHVSDYNHNLMGSLTKQFDNTNSDGNSIGDKYQKLVEERTEASKVYINTLADTINKQMESTLSTNKKMQEEINKQFEDILKHSQQFWTDVLKMNQTLPPLDKFSKDGAMTEIKKDKWAVKI
jgi:methyl-accepting chemotaxis protein